MLEALAQVVPDHPDVVYVILGATHPGVRRDSGEQYRLSLERQAAELGIHNNVLFHNRYVSDNDLKEYLQAADIYATPYRGKEQITSGTLAYAVAAGQAIVSTRLGCDGFDFTDGREVRFADQPAEAMLRQ